MSNSKKILITGASGFIGSFLAETALDRDYDVWAGIRKSSSKEFLQDPRIKFIHLNLDNKEELTAQLQEHQGIHGSFDYIIHNAGATKCLHREDFDKINFQNTVNLIDFFINSNSVPKKFILMSSLSVMGKGNESSYTPFKVEDTPHPNTAYGWSKLKAENYIKEQDKIPYLIFRPTGVYGPREKDYLMMLKSIKSGLNIAAGYKPQHLTFIYVKDLAETIFSGIKSQHTNQTYIVADGDVYTDKQYTSIAKGLLNKKFTVNIRIPLFILQSISIICEYISKITRKPSTLNRDKYIIMSQRNWECDITPLIKDLKFKPKYSLKEGLQESIDWYKKHNWL